MIASKWLLLSASIIAILVLSTIFAAIPTIPRASAQQRVPGANWEAINGKNYNVGTANYSPQTQITKDNVHLLELKWVYPMPSTPTPAQVGGYSPAGGSICATLIVDGIVYQCTNIGRVIALDAATGKTIWLHDLKLNLTRDRLVGNQINQGNIHTHGMTYSNGRIYISAPSCRTDVIDALTGKLVRSIPPTYDGCANIPGNKPPTPEKGYKSTQAIGPTVIESARMMIAPTGTVDENNNGARGFYAAYNIDTGQLLWRFFMVPPAGGDPEWALRECDRGWIMGVRCRDMPRQYLLNDWGEAGAKGGQAGPGWGQYAVDEETGIIYLEMVQPAPDWNATYRPGPNLYTNGVLALEYRTGKVVWYHQVITHDLWDWDCSFNTILGKVGTRKVVYKACKNAFLYAFDASTGELIWYFNAPAVKRPEWSPFHSGTRLDTGPKDNSFIAGWDPRNPEVYKRPWQNWPDTGPYWSRDGASGGFDADIALADGRLFMPVYNVWAYSRAAPVEPNQAVSSGRATLPAPETRATNMTVYALDAATGKVLWSYFRPDAVIRAGVTVTGAMVFVPGTNGVLSILDAETGRLITEKLFGVPLIVPPTFGADGTGRMLMFQPFGGVGFGPFGGTVVPGAITAFGLPTKIPEPQVITKEVIKEVVKEVPKEIIKEVVKEVPKEVVKEVVKEVPKEITKTVTVETIGPLTYGAIGVAVVMAVVAAVALSRRKKV